MCGLLELVVELLQDRLHRADDERRVTNISARTMATRAKARSTRSATSARRARGA